MYKHSKAQQSKNRVHISWGILYVNRFSYASKREFGHCFNIKNVVFPLQGSSLKRQEIVIGIISRIVPLE